MKDMEKISRDVKHILIANPLTRGSDTLLYKCVCEYINPDVSNMAFGFVMANRGQLGLPKFESVSRARRKLQEHECDLRPEDGVTDRRYSNWKAVRKWVEE